MKNWGALAQGAPTERSSEFVPVRPAQTPSVAQMMGPIGTGTVLPTVLARIVAEYVHFSGASIYFAPALKIGPDAPYIVGERCQTVQFHGDPLGREQWTAIEPVAGELPERFALKVWPRRDPYAGGRAFGVAPAFSSATASDESKWGEPRSMPSYRRPLWPRLRA